MDDSLDLDSLMELLEDPSESLSDLSESSGNVSKADVNVSVDQKNCTDVLKPSKVLRDIPLDFSSTLQEKSLDCISSNQKSLISTEEENMYGEENNLLLTEEGKAIERKLADSAKNVHSSLHKKRTLTWKDSAQINNSKCFKEIANSVSDSYSGIRIVNPLIPSDVLQKRMEGRRMIKMSFIENFVKGGDIEGDWVTMGVLVNKLPPKTSKNGKTFSIWKMTDLHDCQKILSMFLFGAAHSEHWKTTIGTVAGFLNPSVMPERDNHGEINLSIDHAGKIMLMGKSKDFGHCRSKKKDGTPCHAVVNIHQCEFCIYHVKKEYQKFSAKRSELQAVYSGREPSLKDKILKKQNVFYGGQMYSQSEKIKRNSKSTSSKDKLTLLNLGLKRKAETLVTEEKNRGIKKLTELYGPEILSTVEKNSEFINNQLAIPSAGSRNLLQYMIKEKSKKEDNLKVISAKDLLKMRDNYQKEIYQKQDDKQILKSLVPQIGKGLQPGETVNLDVSSSKRPKICSAQDFAKLRAIHKIKIKGPIKPQNPNSVKSSGIIANKVKAVLEKSMDENLDYVGDEEIVIPKSRLGSIDMNSDKVKAILNRKSSHAYEVEMAEIEKQESYFTVLEKREKMEEKMASTTEIVCDVVSCKQCQYTAHYATDMCKEQRHPLKCHKAIKRFFACKDCKRRTCCFTKLPKRACRKCGGSNYERTCMLKPSYGPKSETLKIRGDEIKFLNSLR